jgi:hypothetical protein
LFTVGFRYFRVSLPRAFLLDKQSDFPQIGLA